MLLRFSSDSLLTRKRKNGEEVPSNAGFSTSVERYHKLPPPPLTQGVFQPLSLWKPTDIKHIDTRFDNQLTGSQLSEN
jgi:hypothetical protein